MAKIRPITDLRKTSEISELCNAVNEPIFITKNGYEDMVIMSNKTFEKMFALYELNRQLLIAQQQVNNGETVDGAALFEELRKQYEYEV
ncbi:MAG: type II toxin-antitoxin system Phd/YefM family antitoxin [Anaerovoracaceae bacterium]